jgi:hypothetical protein
MAAQNPPQVLRYPYEALTDSTDYLQINLIERTIGSFSESTYLADLTLRNRGKFNNQGTNQVQINRRGNNLGLATQAVKSGDIILLPMPSTINDTNQVNYSEDKLDAITAEIAGAVSKVTNTSLISASGEFQFDKVMAAIQKEVIGPAIGNSGLIRNLILTNLAGQAASLAGQGNLSIDQALARSSGQIINPNVELLFNGPTIRNFRFSFKMTPRNRNEANQIRAIIRSLKKHMSPQDAENNLFLSAPNIFELRYKNGTGNNLYLNRFKQCVLENMSVNYTGENVYATYEDGAPVSTVMDLTFKELEPIYASDYDSGEGKIGVGY